jgi:undecaprenyl diphosphate synthase
MSDIKIPKHIAIIPDGNRRWAKQNGKDILDGHTEGVQRTLDIIEKAKDLGVKAITFWGFSTENWNRGEREVGYLMEKIFKGYGNKYAEKFIEKEARFTHLGRKDRLPKGVMDILNDLEEKSKDYKEYFVNFAIDYGGQDEIVRVVKKVVESGVKAKDITKELIDTYVDLAGVPDLDMIIRTSGEQRLSGLLPWQAGYAELFFVDDYYPEFTADKFEEVVKSFGDRERRFGGKEYK